MKISKHVYKIEDFRPYFDLPISVAATKCGFSETHLKKLCRRLGINKWPYRKLASLKKKEAELKVAVGKEDKKAEISLLRVRNDIDRIVNVPTSLKQISDRKNSYLSSEKKKNSDEDFNVSDISKNFESEVKNLNSDSNYLNLSQIDTPVLNNQIIERPTRIVFKSLDSTPHIEIPQYNNHIVKEPTRFIIQYRNSHAQNTCNNDCLLNLPMGINGLPIKSNGLYLNLDLNSIIIDLNIMFFDLNSIIFDDFLLDIV